ncbi:ParB/RepB/Spo0J family partition protein [Afipia birgiae]|uniref:ParB/RepB/Spo0J family partition protein n=1 Tax=Afipia birgiae TaxID=151414 RepID=UPI00030FA5A7|nr:ParB/RepB/Spo0J family partition protein [Afipia birgiae]
MQKNSTEQNTRTCPIEPPKEPFTDIIKIADIAVRDDWQVRNKIDPTTVSNYKNIFKNGGSLPPIQVALVDGALRLVDGWHRLAALALLGRDTVEATIFVATMSEARWAAANANLAHGLPLKPKEVRNVFNAYITSRRHYKANGRIKSYREMAEDINGVVSYRTLNRWMEKDHPKIAKEMAAQHGGEDKALYHDGGPPKLDHITPLQAAAANLDNALAEVRSMSPEERRALIDYARRLLRKLETITQWSPQEVALGLPEVPVNNDF